MKRAVLDTVKREITGLSWIVRSAHGKGRSRLRCDVEVVSAFSWRRTGDVYDLAGLEEFEGALDLRYKRYEASIALLDGRR